MIYLLHMIFHSYVEQAEGIFGEWDYFTLC